MRLVRWEVGGKTTEYCCESGLREDVEGLGVSLRRRRGVCCRRCTVRVREMKREISSVLRHGYHVEIEGRF